MQNLVNDTPQPKRNYAFVDSIRCICMMSIVMEHATNFDDSIYLPKSSMEANIFSFITQFGKFGTIGFFLLAGFLIGEKFTDYTPGQYLKRRLDSTFIPWLFWTTIFLLSLLIDDYIRISRFNHGVIPPEFHDKLIWQFSLVYLYSSFWFIPNFLICITILLLFKKHLYNKWFGAILLGFTLLYTVNIYTETIQPRHSTAILGFVFFLWLGAQFNRRLDALEQWIAKTSYAVWIALCIVTLALGMGEANILKGLHSVDPFNTLRLSNILYSLACFFLLLRIKQFNFVKFLKPRETTYGIYLLQTIIVSSILPLIFKPLKYSWESLSFPMVIGFLFLRTVLTYFMAYFMVRLLSATKLKWVVGR